MSAIVIDAITKQFGHKAALRGVSLVVEAGQIYGFLGPNGAGKTTTIRCVMDFIRPDAGSISVFDHPVTTEGVKARQLLGYMAADNHFYDNWSAAQHLALAERMWLHLPQADDLTRRLHLDVKVPSRQLSTGNRQKLGLVLALAHQPKLVILDEPTRGMDPLLQQEIQTILQEYRQAGGTVFISSHNLAEVEQLCDQVGIIKDGQMVASKSMADIRAMKAHMVTVTLAKSVDQKQFALSNVEVINATQNRILIKVQGDINPLLHHLAKQDIKDIEITHLPLEEVFMAYYRS
jgi:ABC-2 type transport system ATP-binding protein